MANTQNQQSASAADSTSTGTSSVPKSLPWLDLAAAFIEPPPPLDFVLPGLPMGTVASLVAPGATGKSMASLEIAIAVAGGPDFMGLGVHKIGQVLVVAAEDPENVLRQRLHTFGEQMEPEQRDRVAENLKVSTLLASGINLGSDEWVDLIVQEGKGCRLIIIDTLSRVHTGDENDRRDASKIMRVLELIAQRTGAVVIFLHHVSKSTALGGQSDAQQASRGSSVWVDESRWVGFLKTMDEKEAKKHGVPIDQRKGYIRFGLSKQNYGAPVPDIWLERGDGGLLFPATFGGKFGGRKPTAKTVVQTTTIMSGVELCGDDVPF